MAKLYFNYASMDAGKSIDLLRAAYDYEQSGKSVLLMTSSKDNRSGVGVIATRLAGMQPRQAVAITPGASINELLGNVAVDCVFIDEAQFLDEEQVKQLHRWVHQNNVPVMCYGIRSDFRGAPFPGSAALLALADELKAIHSVCSSEGCGRRATMNMRIDEQGNRVTEGEQVLIGGNSRYRKVCACCFYN